MSKLSFLQRRWQQLKTNTLTDETGQSIVLITFALIGLLAFVGIAVDVGFVFARGTQLQAAVDSAALAGVVELAEDADREPQANIRATQFFRTNGFEIEVDSPGSNTLGIGESLGATALGATQYRLEASLPVDLFFLRLVGWDTITLTEHAVAGIFPRADIYASRRVEDGVLTTSTQGVFGPRICPSYGDYFSPQNFPPSNPEPGDNLYTYNYRILIPSDYPEDIVRVELFDPDSINSDVNNVVIAHTQVAQDLGGMPAQETASCDPNQKNPCVLDTGEEDLLEDGLGLRFEDINPYWFRRVDENRGSGSGDGNDTCGEPGSYTTRYNTQTLYELYYYAQNPDGTIQRIPLASYTGQVGDGARDDGGHQTDMRWVSPGAPLSYDQTAIVPANCGSPNGGADCDGNGVIEEDDTAGSGFEISINEDLTQIMTDPATGDRYIYLDVTTISGASENGFEIWAGPNYYVDDVPSEVNSRNYRTVDAPGSHTSLGVTVFGMGILPMNSIADNRVDVPLVYLGPEYAGRDLYISLFDSDSGANPPITFFFDSISRDDWEVSFEPPGPHSCYPGGCNNQWVDPAYEVEVPGDLDQCDYSDDPANDPNCVPFYGGRLTASYDGGRNDTYQWSVRLEGLPYLIE